MKEWLVLCAKGFLMGAADVVPGVSGGTMALLLGIYARLLRSIRAFDLRLLDHLARRRLLPALSHVDARFLLPLGIGIFAALMFFTRIVPLPALIVSHPELVYGLFFGLVCASIFVLMREIERFGGAEGLLFASGTAFGLLVVNLVPVDTPETWWFVLLSGACAISAMLLPGISGSFILLILHKYAYVFDAIGRLDLRIIAPFAVGVAGGLMLFSRLLVWLLARYYERTLVTITGILLGSLWVIWPFQIRTYETVRDKQRLIESTPVWPDQLDASVAASTALILVGALAVLIVHAMAERGTGPRAPVS